MSWLLSGNSNTFELLVVRLKEVDQLKVSVSMIFPFSTNSKPLLSTKPIFLAIVPAPELIGNGTLNNKPSVLLL